MTPKRIKRRGKKAAGATSTPPMKSPNQGKKKPPVVIKKDSREEILKLNKVKLKKDMTEMYNKMKEMNYDGNSGTAGYMKNRVDMKFFIEEAEKKGLSNSQALALFKKKFKL